MKRVMSDAEMRRRQKLQGKIGRTTSALGLGALGVTGVAAAASKKPGLLKAVPRLKNASPEKMKNTAINTGLVSGGIGGVGGFNQASIYSAEARRRKQPVAKGMSMDVGYYGEEGSPLPLSEIEKAWEPVASTFSAEAKRHRRSQTAQEVLTGGSAAAAAGAVGVGGQAVRTEAKNRTKGQLQARHFTSVKAAQGVRHAKAVKSGKVAAGLAGASLVAGGAAAAVNRKRKGSWASYGKRDTVSAFGVDHNDNPNGQHRETEN